MNSLAAGLGLDQVEADPNKVPDGKYDGHVERSEYVIVAKNDTVAHVITYQIDEGDQRGKTVAQWFTLGREPRDAEGNLPDKADGITQYTPSMQESQKPWYKKAFVDLGVPEDQVHTTAPHQLVGIKVTFGTKTRNGYQNVNFVEKRTEAPVPGMNADGSFSVAGGTPAPAAASGDQELGGLL